MQIEIINPLTVDDWNNRLTRNNESSFFLLKEWADVLVKSYQYEPLYLTIKINDSEIFVPFMNVRKIFGKKAGISLPFSDVCHPITSKEIDSDIVIEKIIEYAKKQDWNYIDFHGGEDLFGTATPSIEYCGHRLDLNPDADTTFTSFKKTTRRNIRKAQKSNIEISCNTSLHQLDDFYYLHCLTRKRHQLPAQPYAFFRNIYNLIIAKDYGMFVSASYQGTTIASSVFFHFGKSALYKFGASDLRYQHLRANNLVMWEAIKRYCENNYKSVYFGRTNQDQHGLRRYKRSWGTIEYPIKYYTYDLHEDRFVTEDANQFYRFIKIIFSKMPIGLLRFISRLLYKYFA